MASMARIWHSFCNVILSFIQMPPFPLSFFLFPSLFVLSALVEAQCHMKTTSSFDMHKMATIDKCVQYTVFLFFSFVLVDCYHCCSHVFFFVS